MSTTQKLPEQPGVARVAQVQSYIKSDPTFADVEARYGIQQLTRRDQVKMPFMRFSVMVARALIAASVDPLTAKKPQVVSVANEVMQKFSLGIVQDENVDTAPTPVAGATETASEAVETVSTVVPATAVLAPAAGAVPAAQAAAPTPAAAPVAPAAAPAVPVPVPVVTAPVAPAPAVTRAATPKKAPAVAQVSAVLSVNIATPITTLLLAAQNLAAHDRGPGWETRVAAVDVATKAYTQEMEKFLKS